jgi:site-specific recombinase XerD
MLTDIRVEHHPEFPGQGRTLEEATKGFILAMRANGRRPASIGNMEFTFREMLLHAERNDWPALVSRLDYDHVTSMLVEWRYRTKWDGKYPKAENQALSLGYYDTLYRRVSAFFTWCVKRRYLAEHPMVGLERPRLDERVVPVFTDEELMRLHYVTDPGLTETEMAWFLALRDRAVLMLFIDTPARKAEMAGLRVEDVDLDEQRVRVFGKGGKERYMPIGPGTAALVHEYLMARAGVYPNVPDLWVDGCGQGMRPNWLHLMMRRLASRAHVANMHLHRFRHTFAYRMIRAGVPVRMVEMLGGWARIPRTYLNALSDSDVHEAHRQVSPAEPFLKRGRRGFGGVYRGID